LSLVLVLSNTQDAHVELVTNPLSAAGHLVARFDTDRIHSGCDLSFAIGPGQDGGARFVVDNFEFGAEQVDAVWWRRPEEVTVGDHLADEPARTFARNEWHAAIHGALRTIDGRWVNHPERLRFARHKVPQLKLARELGFVVPDTCVSADPRRIRTFCELHDYAVVAKLVDAGPPRVDPPGLQYMVYTAPVTKEDLSSDAAIAAAPAIYQAYVKKAYEVRATVVGDCVLAAAIHSQATERTRDDWRRYDLDNTPHEAIELPAAVTARCLQLTHRLGLLYSAIDLVVRPDGEVVFLEINPNGQFGWIEDMTGLPIAASLAELLGGYETC
jgi:glutathione synthase/RimK-type ligase-like ATP-grasp enzyme